MFTSEDITSEVDAMRNRSPSFFRYTDIFENMCSYYLHIGMSWEQFWDGDPVLTKYYRKKAKMDIEQRNFDLWLQGLYVYNAIINSSPAFNFFSKNRKIEPYPEKPLELFESEEEMRERKRKEAEEKELKKAKEKMMEYMKIFNAKFKEENKDGKLNKP